MHARLNAILDVDQDGEREAGRTPKTETLNALVRVMRELRIGKNAEGVTGNDLPPKERVNQHYSNYVANKFPDEDTLPWRNERRTLAVPRVPDAEREPPTSRGPDDVDDLLDRI